MSKNFSETDLAWAAGLVIGEGSFGIITRSGRWRYLQFQMQMYDERAMRRFSDLFGLTLYTYEQKDREHLYHRAVAIGRSAERVFLLMAPHMRDTDKYDQAIQKITELGRLKELEGHIYYGTLPDPRTKVAPSYV